MPVAIKIPAALRKVFDDEAEAAFIDVLNQFDAAQRDGFESALDIHLQAFKEYVDRRLVEIDAKNERRLLEMDAKNEKRFAEMNASIADVKVYMATRLGEYHRSQLRWMFSFFIGTVVTMLGFLLTYLQLMGKP